MRKSTLVLSSALTVLCVGLLAVVVNRVHRSSRGKVTLTPLSERSAPEILAEGSNPSSGDVRESAPRPPRLSLTIPRVEVAPAPEAVSEAVSGRRGVLDEAIKSQGSDPVWTNQVMSVLRTAYQGVEGVSIDSLECGRTLCRVEIGIGSAADGSGRQNAKSGLARAAIATGESSFSMTAPPMPPRLVVYMARENTRLPR